METILVTGAAGFIGSNLTEELLKNNKVIGIDDFNDYYDPKRKEKNLEQAKTHDNFTIIQVDIRDKTSLQDIFSQHKIDKIVHLAARAGVRPSIANPDLYQEVNVQGTRNLLECATEFKVKTFIFGSSSSVYGTNEKTPFNEEDELNNIISPYAQTKKDGEELCKEFHNQHNLNITCLRFFTVYGPRGRPDMAPYIFTTKILTNQPIDKYGDGSSQRDYTYVADIVQGIVAALEKNLEFEIINLARGKTITLNQFIETIENVTEKKAIINQMDKQEGDVPITFGDITKAKSLLNYQPSTDLQEGIKNFMEWYQNE
jgi:UDP-glucuronate 4-epimerase|tara:strand:- start:3959 stop:4903 length:945 start_codon:yes stop_codon:yes gene_type:complete